MEVDDDVFSVGNTDEKREYLQERLPHLDLMYGKITTIGVVVLDLMFSKALDGLTDEMDDLNDEDEDRKNRLNFFLMRFKVECGENELIGAFNTTQPAQEEEEEGPIIGPGDYDVRTGFIKGVHSLKLQNFLYANSEEEEGHGVCAGFAYITQLYYNGVEINETEGYLLDELYGYNIESDKYEAIKSGALGEYVFEHPLDLLCDDNRSNDDIGTVTPETIDGPDKEVVKMLAHYWKYDNDSKNKVIGGTKKLSSTEKYLGQDVLDKMRDIFIEDKIVIIGIYPPLFGGSRPGHAVNGYGMEQDKNDPNRVSILVYDNNFPADSYFVIDDEERQITRNVETKSRLNIRLRPYKTFFDKITVTKAFEFEYLPRQDYKMYEYKHLNLKKRDYLYISIYEEVDGQPQISVIMKD